MDDAETQLRSQIVEFLCSLQWGRVMDDAETTVRHFSGLPCILLQWGRVMDDAETMAANLDRVAKIGASMGPRHG